jgi:hypothetical protein
MKHKPDQAFGHREVFCFFLVFHRALPDLQRMKHKPDQAFGHREVFCFFLTIPILWRTMELGRSGRTIDHAAAAAPAAMVRLAARASAASYGVIDNRSANLQH